jgi:nucleoside-diphosphate-sugar epimerase
MTKLFIYGFGYTADYLAKEIQPKWGKVIGTTRNREKLKNQGNDLKLIHPDETVNFLNNFSDKITHLLISVPPDQDGDLFLRQNDSYFKKNHNLEWIGYLSATSVYGDHAGEYVTEHSELKAQTNRGINRIKAEKQWQELCLEKKLPLHIFRIAGIYGNNRNIYERIKTKKFKNIVKNNHFFSRIHVCDLVNILKASMFKSNPINTYNIADDHPSSMQEVVEFICKYKKLPIPKEIFFQDLDDEFKKNSFYTENKKIANRYLKEDLGIILKYPSYREGYEEIIKNGK